MKELLRFLRDNDLRTILAALNSRDVHPVIQFFKYAVSGVMSLIAYTIIFVALSAWVLPALDSNAPDPDVRASHTLVNSIVAGLLSNTVAYLLNVIWVFTSGRHSRLAEYLLFTVVNLPGTLGGASVQYWLIHSFHWPSWAALIAFVLPNVIINYSLRKLFIFRR